jgi:hypothetical protein
MEFWKNNMELIGSLLLILAVGLLTVLFITRPFFNRTKVSDVAARGREQLRDHQHSSLLAERDRTLTALQELDFDNALGKIPEEEYPYMRAELLHKGAAVLRQLDAFEASELSGSVEDRIEAAVAARRADANTQVKKRASTQPVHANGGAKPSAAKKDPVEDLIATRKRARQESAAGFCPSCGKPFSKSDKFCSKCGKTL